MRFFELRLVHQLAVACAVAGLALPASAADIAILRNGFSLQHERREQLGATTRLYLNADDNSSYIDVPADQISSFEHDLAPRSMPPAAKPASDAAPDVKTPDVNTIVSKASDRHQVDADLIASVIRAESNFNPRAVSRKGAQGLMQLMPGTASQLGVDNAFEPETNVDAGTRYLREMLLRYNGDIAKALAAYNAGAGRVRQYHGVPPYRETRAYVARIIRDFNRKKRAAQRNAATNRKVATRVSRSTSSKRASQSLAPANRG